MDFTQTVEPGICFVEEGIQFETFKYMNAWNYMLEYNLFVVTILMAIKSVTNNTC